MVPISYSLIKEVASSFSSIFLVYGHRKTPLFMFVSELIQFVIGSADLWNMLMKLLF